VPPSPLPLPPGLFAPPPPLLPPFPSAPPSAPLSLCPSLHSFPLSPLSPPPSPLHPQAIQGGSDVWRALLGPAEGSAPLLDTPGSLKALLAAWQRRSQAGLRDAALRRLVYKVQVGDPVVYASRMVTTAIFRGHIIVTPILFNTWFSIPPQWWCLLWPKPFNKHESHEGGCLHRTRGINTDACCLLS
jgi:hypothetical protein